MKIIIDIPESIIPDEVRKVIAAPGYKPKEFNQKLLKAFLKLAIEEIENCELGIDEYKLVLK